MSSWNLFGIEAHDGGGGGLPGRVSTSSRMFSHEVCDYVTGLFYRSDFVYEHSRSVEHIRLSRVGDA